MITIYLHKEELEECPRYATPKEYAQHWVREEFLEYSRPVLVKVSKAQPTNRMHTRFIERSYFYLFYNGVCLIANYPGMVDLWRADSWENMMWFTTFKKDRPKRRLAIIRARDLVGGNGREEV